MQTTPVVQSNPAVSGYQVQSTPVVSLPQPQYQYPTQGTTAMQPQYATPPQQMGQVLQFPSQSSLAPVTPQGYSQSATDSTALLAQTVRDLAIGRTQSPQWADQSSVLAPPAMQQAMAPYQAPSTGVLLPPGSYPAYPTTSPQALPYNPYTSPQQYQNQVSQQGSQYDRNANNRGLATSDELSAYYGGMENAAVLSNALACQYEDKILQMNEALQYAVPRMKAMENLLTDPGQLADYYLALEKNLGELPQFNPQYREQVQEQYQVPQYQVPNYLPGGLPPQNLPPNVPSVPGQMAPAQLAAQYAQNAAQGINGTGFGQHQFVPPGMAPTRPQTPSVQGMGGGMPSPGQALSSTPRHLHWQVIDQLASSGALRGMKLF